MPFYDYKCTKCDAIFEVQKGMNDKLEPVCPKCGGKSQRVFQAPGVKSGCTSCASGGCASCGGH